MVEVVTEDYCSQTLQSNPYKRYRIGDVAQILDLKVHVIRYWESEFKSFISTEKTDGGQRLYTVKEIDLFNDIKKLLYSEGYSISGAKNRLKEMRSEPKPEGTVSRELLTVIKEELQDIRDDLMKIKHTLNSDS